MSLQPEPRDFDLAVQSLRETNQALHRIDPGANERHFRILNPKGAHAVAAGLSVDVTVEVMGDAGYYCAGMNKEATVIVHGNAGIGLAENMMSGRVHVMGDASQAAGATGRGGLLIVEGNTSGRCGISMKGIDIVVKGSIGPMSAFMAQAGRLVVFGDAGEALGDSIYEARLYVRGLVKSLGADCVEKQMEDRHKAEVFALLEASGAAGSVDPAEFRRYGSARQLYHFHVDNASAY